MRRHLGAELTQDRLLDLFVLGRGLDDQIAVAEAGVIGAPGHSRQRRVAILGGQAPALDVAFQVVFDALAALGHGVVVDVEHVNVETVRRADLGDTATHLTATDDADLVDFHG